MKTNNRTWASITVVVLLVFLFLHPMIPLPADSSYDSTKVKFPKDLQIIGDEAFSATAFETLVFGDKLLYIGERAFQNDSDLKDIFIPASVLYIGESAFPENGDLVIYGSQGSYAQKWAEANHVVFAANDIWPDEQIKESILQIILLCSVCFVNEETLLRGSEYTRKYIKSMRPQDRPELYPINYRFP